MLAMITKLSILLKLILAGILVVFVVVIPSLNYSGFCFHQKRFLSDEEKLKIVVARVLLQYPKPNAVHDRLSPGNATPRWNTVKSWPENPIPYQDMNEFFTLNPNCCQVTTNYKSIGGEGDNTNFWGRLTGSKSSIVGVKYLLRYRDENGAMQAKLIEIFPGISNCGELVRDLG